MKKLFTFLFASLVGVSALFADGIKIGDLYYILNESDKTAKVTYEWKGQANYQGLSDIEIPESISYNDTQYTVSSIGLNALSWSPDLISITIPDCVKIINWGAFSSCNNLITVNLGNGVEIIESSAFSSCTSLSNISLPISLKSIGQGAFEYCISLNTISIPDSITKIEYSTFAYCNQLETVILNQNINSIEPFAFYGCTSLKSIEIPNSVTNIDRNSFSLCSNLASVSIGCGLQNIGEYAFSGCENIKKLTMNSNHIISQTNTSNDLKSIFGQGIEECIIGDSVTYIGDCALIGLINLKSIHFHDNIMHIGANAFNGCKSLISIEIPKKVTDIGHGMFAWCSSLTSVSLPEGIENIGSLAFYECSSLTSINIPQNVSSIEERAFNKCVALRNAIIGQNVKSIGDYCFTECSSLNSIEIPNSVTTIGKYAFYQCSNLKYAKIGNSVSSIEPYTFADCSKLKNAEIGQSVSTIEEKAFVDATQLETLTLGEGLRTIKEEAFKGATNISTIYSYRPTPPVVNEIAFDDYLSRFDCKIHVLANSVDMYKVADVWKDFYYILPISSDKVDVTSTDVTVEAGDNSVTFTWPADNAAASYTIEIFKAGELVCTLTFNAKGQLEGIAFAPSRNENAQAPSAEMTAKGWQFTVSGLESATNYGYSLKALDEGEEILAHYEGKFGTTGAPDDTEALIQIDQDSKFKATKLLRNGQVFILRGDKTYTIQGQEIK